MRFFLHYFLGFAALPLFVFAVRSPAQQALAGGPPAALTASIVGTVTDAQDALIPNAVIHISDDAERQERTVPVNGDAAFAINDLPAGTFHLTVSAAGFADWTSGAIVLAPGQMLDLRHIQLS